MVESAAAVRSRPRRLVGLWAVLLLLLFADLVPPAPVASAAPASAPACDDTAFWRCRHYLGTLKPTSVTSEGLSLFMMDPPAGRIVQLRFNVDGSFTEVALPWLPVGPNVKAELGSIVLGPRAF